jgi:hypothetical protein
MVTRRGKHDIAVPPMKPLTAQRIHPSALPSSLLSAVPLRRLPNMVHIGTDKQQQMVEVKALLNVCE